MAFEVRVIAHLLLRSFAAPSQFQLWPFEALQLTYAKPGIDGYSKRWRIATCLGNPPSVFSLGDNDHDVVIFQKFLSITFWGEQYRLFKE